MLSVSVITMHGPQNIKSFLSNSHNCIYS